MDYSIVENLKLEDVIGTVRDLLQYSARSRIYLYDSKEVGRSIIIENTIGIGQDKMFCVENTNKRDVFLLPIDGVLFKKDSKCDCVLIHNCEIDFIEFKSNAANRTNEAIYENYRKASNQLLETLNEFRDMYSKLDMNLDDIAKIESYAVFNKTVPQDNAMRKNIAAKFLIASNGIKLRFENKKRI